MRIALLTLALPALMLAACDEPPQDPEPLDPAPLPDGDAAAAAAAPAQIVGAYDVTMADGSKRRQVLYEDGRYSDTDPAGAEVERGTWRIEGETYCFDPEGEPSETCYTADAYDEAGGFDKLGPDGELYGRLVRVGTGEDSPAD